MRPQIGVYFEYNLGHIKLWYFGEPFLYLISKIVDRLLICYDNISLIGNYAPFHGNR